MVASGSGRKAAAALLACLGLGACEVPRALNPAEIYREVSGANDAARPRPPGLDDPFPSLHTVPPRPERPSPETRDAITAALAADRNRSREPLALREAPGGGAGSAPPPGMAAGPPPRPSLAAAPRIPWAEAPQAPARSGDTPSAPRSPAAARPQAPAPAAPEVPDAAPAPPPAELLGAPPPPPAPDLLGAPPARR